VLLAIAEERRTPEALADAERAYRTALRMAPASARTELSLGITLAEENRLADAERAWTRAASLAPRSAGPLVNLGLLHIRLGRVAEARAELQRALRLEPGNRQASEALAGIGSISSP
jgi:protein O-GlcNAc transferase